MNFTPRSRLNWRPIAMACMLACSSLSAQALGLGRFSVLSGLGEPLKAEVEINQFTAEDLRSLKVQLAAPSSFEHAGMDYNAALTGLQVRLEMRPNGKPVIVLQGRTPARDSFMDLILETQWASGSLAMNYTLLLSPTGATNSSPRKAHDTDITPLIAMPPRSEEPRVANVVTDNTPRDVQSNSQTITVREGDTASLLLQKYGTKETSLAQMLVAMVRANPDAFIEGNINLLRAGAKLTIPSSEEAASIPKEEAQQLVLKQTEDFSKFAQRLARNPIKTGQEAKREISGSVTAEVKPDDSAPEQDKLTLTKGQITTQDVDLVAKERESKDVAEQLAALNKNIESLNALASASEPQATPPATPSTTPALPGQEPTPEPSFFGDPAVTGGAAGLLIALAAFVLWLRRQKSTTENPWDDHEELTTELSASSPSPSDLPPKLAELDLNLDTPATATSPATAPTTATTTVTPAAEPQVLGTIKVNTFKVNTSPTMPPAAPTPAATATANNTDRSKLVLAVQLLEKGEIELARSLIESVAATATGELRMQALQLLGRSE